MRKKKEKKLNKQRDKSTSGKTQIWIPPKIVTTQLLTVKECLKYRKWGGDDLILQDKELICSSAARGKSVAVLWGQEAYGTGFMKF